MFIILFLPISISNNNNSTNIFLEPSNNLSNQKSKILLTAEIMTDEPLVKSNPANDEHYQTKETTLNPTTILRGNSFTVKGRLIDQSTGSPVPIPNEEIIIFWNVFDWDDYAINPTAYRSLYEIENGFTDTNGNFSITCRDSSRSRAFGSITVHTVWDGNPIYGKVEDIRQDIQNPIECYATVKINVGSDPAAVREGKSFLYGAIIRYDNNTFFSAADGNSITVEWLGNITTSPPFVSSITGGTLLAPNGTALGNHALKVSFNVSSLAIPYIVGTIISVSDIGTSTADWCNASVNVNIYSGAGIDFDIYEPTSAIPGENPQILRGNTQINVTGLLTDANGDPYGYSVDLTIKLDNSTDVASVTAENTGAFSVLFQITSTSIPVGEHYLTIEVDVGQSIIATSDLENITILGNSTSTTPEVNGDPIDSTTQLVLANETVQVTGTLEDLYDSNPLVGIIVYGQLESYTAVNSTTSGSGAYTLPILIPTSIDPSINNLTIRIWTDSIQYYTGWNTSFQIDVFTDVLFSLKLNQTILTNYAVISTLNGTPIYNTTTIVFNLTLTDQFGRPLSGRDVTLSVSSIVIPPTLSVDTNGVLIITIPNAQIMLQNGSYTINLAFTDNQLFNFSFTLVVSEQQITSPPPTTGGLNLNSQIAIGILISMVSLIIIISIVYAFGRFRKSKKQVSVGATGEILDLQTIMKLLAEADNAKDYQRAVILCYQAFELICMQDLRIHNARLQSPRELARIVATTNRIPIRDVTMLVMRYEESRYSDHKISKNSFVQAQQALDNIQLALKKEPKTQ